MNDSSPVTSRVKHVYDGNNRWIGREVLVGSDVGKEVYVHDAGQISVVFDGGVLRDRYLWSNGVDQLLAQDEVTTSTSDVNKVVWTLTDHLGSVRDRVGTSSLVSHQVYDAFGNVVKTDVGNIAARDILFGFTGCPHDDETGLQNNHNRWYDPVTGRWLLKDSVAISLRSNHIELLAADIHADFSSRRDRQGRFTV